jgi:hypothetical protein
VTATPSSPASRTTRPCSTRTKWHGHAEIREWRARVATAFEYTVEVLRVVGLGETDGVERHDVYTHLEGNFPGGTVDLTNRFGLRDGRITLLEIVPTEGD